MEMEILGMGFPELVLIILVVFIVFGPRRLFEMSRKAGKMVGDLSRAASGFSETMKKEMDTTDLLSDKAKSVHEDHTGPAADDREK
jgi:Tat protein translocase TatB subunit